MAGTETLIVNQLDLAAHMTIQEDPLSFFEPTNSYLDEIRTQTNLTLTESQPGKEDEVIEVTHAIVPLDGNLESQNYSIKITAHGLYKEDRTEKTRRLKAQLEFRGGRLDSAQIALTGKWLRKTPESTVNFTYDQWANKDDLIGSDYWVMPQVSPTDAQEIGAPKDNIEFMFNIGELLFGTLMTHGKLAPQSDFLRRALRYGSFLITPHTKHDDQIPIDINLSIKKHDETTYSILCYCLQKAQHRNHEETHLDFCHIVRAGWIRFNKVESVPFISSNCSNNPPLQSLISLTQHLLDKPGLWCLDYTYFNSMLTQSISEEMKLEDIMKAARKVIERGPHRRKSRQKSTTKKVV